MRNDLKKYEKELFLRLISPGNDEKCDLLKTFLIL